MALEGVDGTPPPLLLCGQAGWHRSQSESSFAYDPVRVLTIFQLERYNGQSFRRSRLGCRGGLGVRHV